MLMFVASALVALALTKTESMRVAARNGPFLLMGAAFLLLEVKSVIQFSLLTRPLPSPEQLSTLMARLTALMGEGRCGSAVTVDSWEPGAFEMKPFAPLRVSVSPWPAGVREAAHPHVAVRRFRSPVPPRT